MAPLKIDAPCERRPLRNATVPGAAILARTNAPEEIDLWLTPERWGYDYKWVMVAFNLGSTPAPGVADDALVVGPSAGNF